MSEDNNNLVRHFVRDVLNAHKVNELDQLLSQDFVYSSAQIKEKKNLEWIKDLLFGVFTSFPDFTAAVESFNNRDDLITIKISLSGTMQENFMGIAATQQSFTGPGVLVFKVFNQKIQQIQAGLATNDYLAQLTNPTSKIAVNEKE